MATLDWKRIETEYITGQVSYQALAEKYGVHKSQVDRRGRAGGWVQKRREFRRKTAAKGRQKAEIEAIEASALIFRIGRLILERFLDALQTEAGVRLTPTDAQKWARILLDLEKAGQEADAGPVFGADLLAAAALELRAWREDRGAVRGAKD